LSTVEKVVTLTFAIVALGLILTNPNGDKAAGSAVTDFYTSAVKALQMR